MRRSVTTRLTALLLALLGSLSAPGAALAHGAAHHREHHVDHHAPASNQADGEHGGHHDDHASHGSAPDTVETRPARAPHDAPVLGARVQGDEPTGSHGHPTLDLPVRPRVELATVLPFVAIATLLASPKIDVATGPLVPHAALARPDPDAAAPPRTRAPPLR